MILGIIQARMGSTRLPGKVLKLINNKPILKYCIDQITKSKLLDKLVIATSTNVENNKIVRYCLENNIEYFRGSENDLLDRYYQCAKHYNGDIIVRFTSDCPLIDPKVIDKVINYYLENNYDIVHNTWFEDSYPSGFDVEVFNFPILEDYWKTETDLKIREHVMHVKTSPYSIGQYKCKTPVNIHLSVDTIDDFKLIEHILNNLQDITYDNVIKFII